MKKLSKMIMILIGVCAILGLEGTRFPSDMAFAQSVRGSLSGSVLDQSGAATSGSQDHGSRSQYRSDADYGFERGRLL